MSLERRLLTGIAIALLGAFALLLWGGSLAVRQVTEDYLLTRLEHDLEAVLAIVTVQADGLQLDPNSTSPIYRQPLSGHYYLVRSGEQLLRSRSLWDETLPLRPLSVGERQQLRMAWPGDQRLLALAGGYRKQGAQLTVLVAEDISALDARIADYRRWLTAGFLLLTALLLGVLRWLLRSGFRRLDRVQDDMRQVAAGHRQQLDEAVPAEVQPLVHEFNRLLALLGQRLSRSRNALGNLAHALKTPLSLITQELDRPALDETRRQAALAHTQRIRELVDRELRRARIAGAGSPGQRFAARQEVPALLETLRRLYRDRALQLDAQALPTEPLAADREDMLELLGNLLDNACKWAEQQVLLSFEPSGAGVCWMVEDDGAGVTADQLQRLAERGSRLDESREGHGLGLAIARDIVALYGGELLFDRSPRLGGLRVRASLQLAGPAH
jgi:signal transduction histidine kinase